MDIIIKIKYVIADFFIETLFISNFVFSCNFLVWLK